MKRSLLLSSCALLLTFEIGCSSSDSNTDIGNTPGGDTGVRMDARPEDATTTNPDATEDAGVNMDATEGMDAEGMDAVGMDATTMLVPQMEPGDHVQVVEGRVDIGDTFAEVKTALGGPGTRSMAMNARSYEYTLSGNVELAIWYANTNLDDDDAAPADVDDTDRVLWIAVSGPFTGKTAMNIGIGSTRTEVETAYGAAPHTVDITAPAPGTLAQYFVRGMLVAYDQANMVRTMTISRAYPVEPSGTINVGSTELDFGNAGSIRGFVSLGQPGSRQSDVTAVLGEPDGRGNVVVMTSMGPQTLGVMSYGFFGVEVFHAITPGLERVLFLSVHSPYYGVLDGSMATIGSARADIEAALGLGTGMASTTNMQLICYDGGGEPDVGVTYSTDATPLATTITTPLLSCP